MSFMSFTVSLLAGGLQLAVAAYALRLNRRFGAGRVGWSLFCAFALLALAHGVPSLLPSGGPVRSGPALEGLYALVSVLLLAGMMHLEALLTQRQRTAAAEEARREELTTEVRKKTAYLTRAVEELQAEIEAHQQLESQYVEAQKMAILGQLVGGITSDLDGTLKKIMNSAELLIAGTGSGNPLSKHTTDIVLAAERAAVLNAQLLAFGPGQAAQTPALLDLNGIVISMNSVLHRLTGDRVELDIISNRNLGRIKAAPASVAQVLMNFVLNAVEAVPDGGKITISLEKSTVDGEAKAPDRNYAVLTVTDTGIGMADEVKARLFEPFFSTKPKGKGLGLVVCWTILKQIGGHIEVQSALGKGTTIKAFFPLIDPPPERVEKTEPGTALPRGTETVLIVEDDASVRQLAKRSLEAQGYSVLIAVDGQEGLKTAREHAGRIHLVLADVVMPQMDGRAMGDWLKAVFPEIKILFTSGYVAPDDANDRLFESGAGFLPKPFNTATLVLKVREILDQPA